MEKEKLYNFRADATRKGSLSLGTDELTATYLLLYEKGKANQATLYRRKNDVQIWLKKNLKATKYPSPGGETYLVVEIETVTDSSLQALGKRLGGLTKYTTQLAAGRPFVIGLEELVDKIGFVPKTFIEIKACTSSTSK